MFSAMSLENKRIQVDICGEKSDGVGVLTNADFSADPQTLNTPHFRKTMSWRSADAACQCAGANLFKLTICACAFAEVLQAAYKGQKQAN